MGLNRNFDEKRSWDAFAKAADDATRQAAKEVLILHYSPMIKFVVGRLNIYVGSAVDQEDLISYGIFGLIDAIDKFDHTKGAKFETYASLRIRGAVLDGIRALDWVPRTMRQKSRQLEEAYKQLEAELGREPTDKEVAVKLGIPEGQITDEIKKSSLMSLISLDDYLDQNHEKDFVASLASDEGSPEGVLAKEELKKELADAISVLTEKEQMVVALYYYEELTLKEISKVLNVSESRVSQIHSKAMLRLRTRLGKHKSLFLA